MAELQARLAACEKENAELKERNAWLDAQLAQWDPVYSIRRALPSDQEAEKLLRRVVSRFPHMREQNVSEADAVANFKCALAFTLSLPQTKEPCTKYSGSWWINEAAMWCSNARIAGRPRTLLPAIIVSDVPYHLDHASLFLDPIRSKGVAVDRNAWRRLVDGGDLRAATPIKAVVSDGSIGFRRELAPSW